MTNGVYDVYDVYDAFLTNPLTKSVRISIFSNLFLFFLFLGLPSPFVGCVDFCAVV